MRLYKRSIQVVVGDDNEATHIENLKIELEVIKEANSKPADGFVKIFNMNESTEARIRNRGERIQVLAGYDDLISLIFDGDIRKVERDRQGLDRVVIIKLGGNVLKTTRAVFVKSYAGEVPAKKIIEDALPSFSLTNASLDILPNDLVMKDFAWSGRTSDMLNRILEPQDIQWYENDGTIAFSKKGEAPEEFVFVLSPDTGMIGSPSITDDGVKVSALLNAQLRINTQIKIESDVLDQAASGDRENARAANKLGFYKIIKITHRGDNRDGEFVTELLATPLE